MEPAAERCRLLLAGALVVLTVSAYLPALTAGFVWDDDAHVITKPALTDAEGLRRIWLELGATQQYYPVVYTSFWIEHHLWGDWSGGYHAVNVLLHAANAVLLGLLLRRLSVRGAWLAAAIFALHPVHVESVAWISERKNLLSALFYLLAMSAYLRFREVERDTQRGWFYAAALGLFVLAVLSKTVVASLPAALLLLIWWKHGRLMRADVMPLLPFFAIGTVLGLLTVFVEEHKVGAFGSAWELSAVERVLVAGRALWFYAGKLLWPSDLTFIYPRWEIDAGNALLYGYPLAEAGVIAGLWVWRAQIGRGPLVAVLFFAGTLFPALGFFDVYPFLFSFVADHFQYLASAGMIALLAAGLAALAGRLGTGPAAAAATAAAIASLLAGFGSLTRAQAATYRDARTLWETTIERNPTAWLAHHNLGAAYSEAGDLERGLAKYNLAIELKPDYADAYNNRGTLYLSQGDVARAIEDYSRAIEFQSDHLLALTNRGGAYHRIGRLDLALADFERVVELAPENARGYRNLATAHLHAGQYEQAVAAYTRAIELSPGDSEPYRQRCECLRRLRRYEEALNDCNEAVRVGPTNWRALVARARVLVSLQRYDLARDDLVEARRQGVAVPEGLVDRSAQPSDGPE